MPEIADIQRHLGRMDGSALGLALSGGGDSQALAALAADWARGQGRTLAAATVDHGLRAAAATEAAAVAAFCRELGIAHDILHWTGWTGKGNLQDAARQARHDLIAEWAREREITALATGHTRDDQAETLLLRLARGSGVDGLAAMAPARKLGGITWHRPLLGVSRAALRDYLTLEGIPWVEDPSNDDDRFDRVKARRALAALAPLGIDAPGLARTADRMALARRALEKQTQDLARGSVRADRGDVVLDWAALQGAPQEIRDRLIAHVLMWVSGAQYRPRLRALSDAVAALAAARNHVLAGCRISAEGAQRRVTRELAAVADTRAAPGEIWDGRWRLVGPDTAQAHVSPLGDIGIRDCPHWRDTGLPRTSLIASPAVWSHDRLIAAPLAGMEMGWKAELVKQEQSLIEAIITH